MWINEGDLYLASLPRAGSSSWVELMCFAHIVSRNDGRLTIQITWKNDGKQEIRRLYVKTFDAMIIDKIE